jgi:hypothetical protein
MNWNLSLKNIENKGFSGSFKRRKINGMDVAKTELQDIAKYNKQKGEVKT